jgi:serine/threonine-protein kinase RsbW/stage II sporulation protein AB (anti-sigma F factor)
MKASTTDRIDLRLPALAESIPHIRHAIMSFAERHGYRELEAIGLAVTEAATNAVLHAYVGSEPGDVRAVACAEAERLVVVVRDWGTGMAPRLDTPGLGLGLPTIAALAASFDVEAADGRGTLMRMQFEREATPAPA